MIDTNVIFKAISLDGTVVNGYFTKKKIGNLIVPVIERYREHDNGDYMESIEIDGDTLEQIVVKRCTDISVASGYKHCNICTTERCSYWK